MYIRTYKFKSLQPLVEAVKDFRTTCAKETESMTFKGKEELIYQETERLLIKGFETLSRSTGAASTLLQR